tara:strand:+ start:589 stop:852 length:264 start_codon:yes stop_codon:yes gene_type:complete
MINRAHLTLAQLKEEVSWLHEASNVATGQPETSGWHVEVNPMWRTFDVFSSRNLLMITLSENSSGENFSALIRKEQWQELLAETLRS